MNFPVDLCMSARNQYKITCYTYLRPKYIHLTFIVTLYHSILLLYYVNICTYPCQTTYFKTQQIGIHDALYVYGAKRWLQCHVRPSDIQTCLQYYKAFVILETINMNFAIFVQQNFPL